MIAITFLGWISLKNCNNEVVVLTEWSKNGDSTLRNWKSDLAIGK